MNVGISKPVPFPGRFEGGAHVVRPADDQPAAGPEPRRPQAPDGVPLARHGPELPQQDDLVEPGRRVRPQPGLVQRPGALARQHRAHQRVHRVPAVKSGGGLQLLVNVGVFSSIPISLSIACEAH